MTGNDDNPRKDELWELAYPKALRTQEEKLLGERHRRRCQCAVDESQAEQRTAQIGLALSGGGIRSATFAFGVLQTLARQHILDRVDVLSTVSGGGYTGALLTRLLARKEFSGHDAVRRAILPPSETAASAAQSPQASKPAPGEPAAGSVLRWLRDNGRYLAPKGSGDLLLAGAILLRNWISVHFVLGTLVLALFVLMQFPRAVGQPGGWMASWLPPDIAGGVESLASFATWLTCSLPLLWWSPWVLLPALLSALWVVPTGCVYWLARDGRKYKWLDFAALILVVAFLVVYLHQVAGRAPAAVAGLSGLITAIMLFHRWCSGAVDHELRNRLSSNLKTALLASGFTLAFALVDTIGQTVYTLWLTGTPVTRWLAIGSSGVAGAFVAARRIAAYFSGEGRVPRVRFALKLAAPAATVLLLTMSLVALDVVAHGIAWNFGSPTSVPKALIEWPKESRRHRVAHASPRPGRPTFECAEPVALGQRSAVRTGGVALFLFALTLLMGGCRSFLNSSSLLPLYVARLTRAYLGASNPVRLKPASPWAVAHVHRDDDVCMNFKQPVFKEAIAKGAPLHLMNVTINETLDGKLRLQQTGRKGIGMAVGPAGVSAGVRHHAVRMDGGDVQVFPSADTYRMFDYQLDSKAPFGGESLRLGEWVGISGAAFSTGLGWRTNPAVSFLAGFFNVRLGYWWDSGVDRPATEKARTAVDAAPEDCDPPRTSWLSRLGRRFTRALPVQSHLADETAVDAAPEDRDPPRASWPSRLGRRFTRALPVQSHLLDEFVGRFHGTARRYWCLTDGGHFDNTGAYELIRRRVPLIVVIDAEADPEGSFQGLGTLVRKVRSDFGAEIEFRADDGDGEGVRKKAEPVGAMPYADTLDALRPRPVAQPAAARADAEGKSGPRGTARAGSSMRSLAHASVAEVRYSGDPNRVSILVYVKPTLVGNEPADIGHYHSQHPDYPHEATADQFFEEAQWESYRKLGELIAERVFGEGSFELYCAEAKISQMVG